MSTDLEKNKIDTTTSKGSNDSVINNPDSKSRRWSRFVDSFRKFELEELDPNLTQAERVAIATARAPLQRHLKSRHLQMIAIGGAIGTGLFVGSGKALRTGGPASILIAWAIMGTMMFCTVQSLGELAVTFPVSGGYTTYFTRFVDESFGFAITFNILLQWLIVMPLEIVAAAITVQYWGTPKKYVDGFVALFYILIVIINYFGVKGYGEAEFVFSLIKVLAVIGFIILGIILVCGGGPKGGYIGGKHWHNPGAFNHGFKGLCSVFVTAAFSFAGTELVGLAAAETDNPRIQVPNACKQTFWRITLFYIVSLLLIGLLLPFNDNRLLGTSSVDASASPFVLSIKNAGIQGLPSVINVVILVAVLSVGNSAVYAASRVMNAMSEQGYLPTIFGYIDRKGRPLVGITLTCVIGLLSFIAASPKEGEVFNWLMALSGMISLFTWSGISLCHIRFRRALAAQGRTTEELAFVSRSGVLGSFWSLSLNVLIFIAQFWVALWPVGQKGLATPDEFFSAYLSVPIVFCLYVGHKLWTWNWKLFIKAKDVDIDTGRREVDYVLLKQLIAEEDAELAVKPLYYRVYKFLC